MSQKVKSGYALLKSKDILAILDGDTKFDNIVVEGEQIKCTMPYLSGSVLCEISKIFGMQVEYGSNGNILSRWKYLENLLQYCIDHNKISDLLDYLFSKKQFEVILKGHTSDTVKAAYDQICEKIINNINGVLCFSNYELLRVGGNFIIQEIGTTINVAAPTIKLVERSFITSISERALQDIADGNYDSAITKSRTLLEEVFIYVIEQKGEKYSANGDIAKLYGQVKTLYHMHQVKEADTRINKLLTGLERILSGITEMRNANSDAHGVGAKRIALSDYHARLFVNSATTMADFILSVSQNQL